MVILSMIKNQLKHDERYGDLWLIDLIFLWLCLIMVYPCLALKMAVVLSGKLKDENRRIWGFPKLANITSTVANIHWLTCRKMQIDLGMFKYLVNTWLNIWSIHDYVFFWFYQYGMLPMTIWLLSGGWFSRLFMFSLFETGWWSPMTSICFRRLKPPSRSRKMDFLDLVAV